MKKFLGNSGSTKMTRAHDWSPDNKFSGLEPPSEIFRSQPRV